jgi:hypothetical protein
MGRTLGDAGKGAAPRPLSITISDYDLNLEMLHTKDVVRKAELVAMWHERQKAKIEGS